jgi:thiol-disulfide isomerase/thioredoxin
MVTYFFIDTTSITINEIPQDYEINHSTLYCSLKGGIENKVLQALNPIEVVGIQTDLGIRKVQIDSIKSYIAKNPSSLYLFKFIYTQKGILDKTELKSIYKLFHSSLLNSNIGKKLGKHIAKIDSEPNYKNVELLKPDNSSVRLYDSLKDINLIIFWASWCGPCRAEIPDLKKLYNLYSKNGLRIISISIDDNRESWMRQIEKENMNWLQLSGNNAQIEKVKSEFDIVSIPVSIFVDKHCKLIKRLEGKRIDSFEEYQSFIEQYINR